eukprot:scaffold102438_cov38-Cyclotella_meneghiniana.AAC.1
MFGGGWDWVVGSNVITTMCFGSWLGYKFGLARIALFTPRLSDFGLIQAIHSIPTIQMSHYEYNEWLEKVEIGIHPPQPSSHSGF